MFPAFALYMLAINLAAFAVFRADKRRAELGQSRVPERELLLLALVGGWPGANAARHVFRHKTRKEPFASLFRLIGFSQAIGLGLLLLLPR